MRVKMLTLAAGPRGVWKPGQIVQVTAEEGEALIAGGFAEALAPEAAPETADKQPQERAVSRRGKSKSPARAKEDEDD